MTDKSEKHYAELPEETRRFIEDLREEDVTLLKDGIRLVLALRTVSTFTKWVLLTLVGTFLATVVLTENIIKVIAWIKGGK